MTRLLRFLLSRMRRESYSVAVGAHHGVVVLIVAEGDLTAGAPMGPVAARQLAAALMNAADDVEEGDCDVVPSR